ncbi:kinase-like domain-containing protein [Gigaspora rosea]|uniref:Kinase-like domain-containing protein n=1 Tax=Gigaspora rosea TaxID=44941 RepID=A0A397W6L2_9GLOM|nr:kinase-like domain-containing protein [Gigaspora rosea]
MIFQYADNGSLYKYLRENFNKLTWQAKLKILSDCSLDLLRIHDDAKYIHADFHSGNILQGKQSSYISDLGLSRKTDESVLEGEIYGVMPYVAPEVLLGKQQFTQAADIYGFGVIMTEITSGQRPFDGIEFNLKLAVKICSKGLRPEFAPGTPKCYIELAEKCMDSDPQKRPRALDIRKTIEEWLAEIALPNSINEWLEKISSSNDNEIQKLLNKIASINDNEFNSLLNKIDDYEIKNWVRKIAYSNDNEIKELHAKLASSSNFNEIKDLLKEIACNGITKQFIEADKIIKSLPISKHSDEKYTSKIISTKLISKAIQDKINY